MNSRPTFRQRADRRGTVLAAVIILLLLLEVAIFGIVSSETNAQHLGVDRLNTVRAFYNAEAGINMSIREVFTNVDEDTDGGIGTISDDGNDGNNPSLNQGSFVVSAQVMGADTVLTSAGDCSASSRFLQATISSPP